MQYTSVQSVRLQVHGTEEASEALHPNFIHQDWACALTQGFTD